MAPEVSIVIPTRGRSDHLANLLSDLKQTGVTERAEVIVVDEGGTFAEQCNEGARRASGGILLLCNDDIRPIGDLLSPKWYLGNIPQVEVLGCRLVYPNGLIQSAGIGFDAQGNPYSLWQHAPSEHPEVMQARYLPAVTFACAMIGRGVWQTLGGLDEGFVNAYEDVDFCLRAKEEGFSVRYLPGVTAMHLEGQSAGRHDHDQESFQHFHRKWLETGRLWKTLGVWPFTIGGAS